MQMLSALRFEMLVLALVVTLVVAACTGLAGVRVAHPSTGESASAEACELPARSVSCSSSPIVLCASRFSALFA